MCYSQIQAKKFLNNQLRKGAKKLEKKEDSTISQG